MTHPSIVSAMTDPLFYPDPPESVECIQTHISFIFIAGEMVFKVKKAVDFGFLDFTTLEKRKYYCEEEVRLNRRLARDIYLDVVEIRETAEGSLALDGPGRTVEYAVRMKKIPQERMLNRLLAEGTVDDPVMDAVARKVHLFHREAETGGEIDRTGGFDTICRNHEENFEQTEEYIGTTITEGQYRFIRNYVYHFLQENRALFDRRVQEHRIRDCHGDLHLEHICITGDDIVIFDCIEFNKRFRYLDVAAEVSFLAMDLDYNDHPWLSDHFINSYLEYSDDRDIAMLLNFYKCYFAYVRAKVIGFKSKDTAVSPEERAKAVETASRYFDLSVRYAARPEKPIVIIMAGLMGTGKSVLARNMARFLEAEIIRSDVVRKEMLSRKASERHYEPFGAGIYSEEISQKTYERVFELAAAALEAGRSVIIDASFRTKAERERARALAETLGADLYVVESVCPGDVVRKRLDRRMSDRNEASDGRWEIYHEQKARFEKIDEFPNDRHIIIDTSGSETETTREAVLRIRLPGSAVPSRR